MPKTCKLFCLINNFAISLCLKSITLCSVCFCLCLFFCPCNSMTKQYHKHSGLHTQCHTTVSQFRSVSLALMGARGGKAPLGSSETQSQSSLRPQGFERWPVMSSSSPFTLNIIILPQPSSEYYSYFAFSICLLLLVVLVYVQ